MILAIVGGRDFNNVDLFLETVTKFNPSAIISGGAAGADTLAEQYAKTHAIPLQVFQADWKKYGRQAGPIRNKLIVESSDEVLAFWDGSSKGTQSTIKLATKANKKVHVVSYCKVL
jgi:predicted Rossmann fold nucleotide-binding protein DprA/Smf involved in DNA uptake